MKCGVCRKREVIYSRTAECAACYRRRLRKENPEIAARDRAGSRAWKERNREANRARDREYAKTAGKTECPGCGAVMDHDSAKCRGCRLRAAELRRDMIAELYNRGLPMKEIAEIVGTSRNAVGVYADRLRKEGRIGYRHNMG